MKVKYRKCPECGGKMLLRKSHSKGTKFWGCVHFKDNDCNGTAPYYGDGARAGLDLDIREIENGYITTTAHKYTATIEEETVKEVYSGTKEDLRAALNALVQEEVEYLLHQIENSTEFVDEINKEKHKTRVKVAQKGGTKDVSKLLAKIKKAKEAEKLED